MTKFRCAKCNYKFEAMAKYACPYCGATAVDNEKSASELVDEIEDILEE